MNTTVVEGLDTASRSHAAHPMAGTGTTAESSAVADLRHALLAVEAAEAQAAAQPAAHAAQQPASQALSTAWLRVARCWRAMGAPQEAHNSLRHALREARALRGGAPALISVLCEMAENTCDMADRRIEPSLEWLRMSRDKARDEVFEASSWLLRAEPSDEAAHTLLRLSDVLNRCGDHDDATVLQARALSWMAAAAAAATPSTAA